MAATSRCLSWCRSPEIAEAMAVHCGVQMGLQLGLNAVMVESDSKAVINMINRHTVVNQSVNSIIHDIKVGSGVPKQEHVLLAFTESGHSLATERRVRAARWTTSFHPLADQSHQTLKGHRLGIPGEVTETVTEATTVAVNQIATVKKLSTLFASLLYNMMGVQQKGLMYRLSFRVRNKRPEFTAWLAEVKQVNLESLPNWEEKQMFKQFMEDHNTATFPSKKYYSLDAYYKRQMEKEMKKGVKNIRQTERTVFNDEEIRRQEMQQVRERQKEEQVEALKREMQSGMAQAMKEQAQLREEMAYHFKLGHFEAAAAIQRRLDPDVPM
ncbi:hypothetical protein RHSIM_Rhsim06G0197200 [Rhododendron simsii]|uniref:RNase H type-1 domain-containing protein n=1 Tax=Rhododendron simsii TaxID=118357 RepID=A0A834GUM6_RHOSS|nr:hypothetical protein RHSIM_Rhsim06G0197200 [Rhododendron simsii]